MLDVPSTGELLRASGQTLSKGPRPRAALATIRQLRRAVARDQYTSVAAIDATGATVLGSVQNVLSAVFVRGDEEQLAAIRRLPGVQTVVPVRRYAPALQSSSEIVGVPAARQLRQGVSLLGEGIKIGIIDSGLDFGHRAFQDDSLPALASYPRGDPQHLHLTSSKVVVARSYVHLLNSRSPATSTPDDESPWDASGHGTAVAMIAAGKEVDTPAGVVSGIAPKARVGVYKVFGTPGLNYYTADHTVISALDDAVEDGMDIVNLSLGNPMYYRWDAAGNDCGRGFEDEPCDPLAVAAQRLAEDLGVVVVAAAGNDGGRGLRDEPAASTIIVPGNAPAVVTVGGTGNSAAVEQAVRVGDASFPARTGTGPDADGALSAPALLAAALGNPRGCRAFPEGSLSGRLVVIDRGDCYFVEKVEHADAAGAAGVLVVNHQGEALVRMALLEDTDIPAFFVGGTDGESIAKLLASTASPLTLDPAPVITEQDWAFVNPRSSRGPTLALQPKPDLVAPSLDVYSAAPRYNPQGTLYTPSGFRSASGTSFAAPMVAGAAALVWQSFPEMTARQVASALINSASAAMLADDEPVSLTAAGAGVLRVAAAMAVPATVVPPTVALSPSGSSRLPERRQIRIANPTSAPQVYSLAVVPREGGRAARVTVGGRARMTLRLQPGRSVLLQVRVAGGAPPPGYYEGSLRLTASGSDGALSVPYYFVVGDNEPHDALILRGRNATGIEGEVTRESVVARVIDRFGVPVAGREVRFVPGGLSVRILRTSPVTTPSGILFATVEYGPDPGEQLVVAKVGGLNIEFTFERTEVKPTLASVASSATMEPAAVAPGSLVTISGSDFASHSSGRPPTPQVRRLPLSRKGASVSFDAPSSDVSVAGRIAAITVPADDSDSLQTLAVQVPWELAGAESAYVKVRTGRPSAPLRIPLAAVAPGIFHYQAAGSSYAMALRPDGTAVSDSNPARRGEAVTFTMTGNGPVAGTPPTGMAGSLVNTTIERATVWIGGVQASVTYSGLDPGLAGLYLMTVIVPQSLETTLPAVSVQVGAELSNSVLLPIQ